MLRCLQGRRHEDSDSEDEWTDEEDDSEALDTADPFLYFADTLRAVQMRHPARFQVWALHATSLTSTAASPCKFLLGFLPAITSGLQGTAGYLQSQK